jgi:sulfur relay protein TusB/DsrH
MKADSLGVILVENGIYHAVVKENGKESPVLSKQGATFYALSDDLETRGYTAANVNPKVKLIGYGDIVDLIMNDYEKTAWL